MGTVPRKHGYNTWNRFKLNNITNVLRILCAHGRKHARPPCRVAAAPTWQNGCGGASRRRRVLWAQTGAEEPPEGTHGGNKIKLNADPGVLQRRFAPSGRPVGRWTRRTKMTGARWPTILCVALCARSGARRCNRAWGQEKRAEASFFGPNRPPISRSLVDRSALKTKC